MPPNEQTPLLTTVIVAPPRQRYSHNYVRRFCTVALGITLLIVVVLFLVPARWLPGNHNEAEWSPFRSPSSYYPSKSWPASNGLDYEELQNLLLKTPDEHKAREWSQYYTAGPHLAGKNLSQAEWTKDRWEEFGIASNIVDYHVYINYPISNRLALLETNEEDKIHVRFECSMEEDALDEDATSRLENRIPTFHGYSASGNVTSQYVFVNFGTYWDFNELVKANISLEGKIAVAKYGRNFRGLKTKRAQELGMIGVVMYTDPQEDGEITELNGYKAYPQGPARQASSVQRGSTQFLCKIHLYSLASGDVLIPLAIVPGDPTTPGYPSKPGVPRIDPHHSIPTIPSVPISYRDALPILRALNGHGPTASQFNEYWQGGGLGHKGVDYNIGPSPADLVLNLVNEQEYITTPLWNVIGIINGTLTDEVVILGNHRDAWIAGGAGDPNSGSAAMNEVIRSFGAALKGGWKPLRTIVFASWDGEEYGLVGSTEWVEEYLPWLSAATIAYLNVDVGARGPQFTTSASPLLNDALYEATSLVQSPNQTVLGQTVRDLWNGHINTMGSGSDFTAFQDFAGIPSVDLGFATGPKSAVYHYHSNYDSFAWMDHFGDPGWHYHTTITKVWAVLAAALVETPVIGFNATNYSNGLKQYLASVKTGVSEGSDPFPSLTVAISHLHDAAIDLDTLASHLAAKVRRGVPWWKWWQKAELYRQIKVVNNKYKYLERQFLYVKGLDGRPWFKHVVFAPGIWTGYAGATFPGLVESQDNGDMEGVEKWTAIIKERIDAATKSLK